MQLSWIRPVPTDSVDSYIITWYPDDTPEDIEVMIVSGADSSATVPNLEPGQTYVFSIRSSNQYGFSETIQLEVTAEGGYGIYNYTIMYIRILYITSLSTKLLLYPFFPSLPSFPSLPPLPSLRPLPLLLPFPPLPPLPPLRPLPPSLPSISPVAASLDAAITSQVWFIALVAVVGTLLVFGIPTVILCLICFRCNRQEGKIYSEWVLRALCVETFDMNTIITAWSTTCIWLARSLNLPLPGSHLPMQSPLVAVPPV